ncbi:transcription factor MafB [Hyalella azteca]|uniref:Transcription factor MafB n=1 Tax=Hyalella azteca TaxID=294128 RepID=A0A979FHZ9_HYAAZ|nr:transcription factor MafB [Hyalella azteca]
MMAGASERACPMQPPHSITADGPGTIIPSNDYEMNFMMEPLDDIICGKESPFISPSAPMITRSAAAAGASVVQTHMTNTTWMNNHPAAHPIHNHHLQPTTHQIHQIKIHPQGPGTPPDTPPGFSPISAPLPPSPPFVPQQTTAIVEEMWAATTSYNRYLEPLDLRHGPPQLYPDPIDQQPFYVDRKWELVQQRQTQLQMPLIPIKQHHHHHHHHQPPPHHHQQQPAIHHQHQPQQTASHLSSADHQSQLLTASHYEISDEELLGLSVRDLNKRLHSMNKDMQTQVKQRRRTLKNRGYAQSCRTKRQEQKSKLEIENGELKEKLSAINQQLSLRAREIESLRKENEVVIRENHLLRHQQHQQQQQQQQAQQSQHQHQHEEFVDYV